jgi:hypothetical protein
MIKDVNIDSAAAISMDKVSTLASDKFRFEDDFFDMASGDIWTVVADSGGVQAVIDGAGGIVSVKCDGDNNDEAYLTTDAQAWLFAADKAVSFKARVKLTEANVNDSAIFVGFTDQAAANMIVDGGLSPASSYDGAGWFKAKDTLLWQTETSNAGTQVTTASAATFTSGSWAVLQIDFDPNDDVTGKVRFTIDGTGVATHDITIAGLQEMFIVLGVKAGAANEETLLIDYVKAEQDR